MSLPPNEVHDDDPMNHLLLEFTGHQEPSNKILLDHRFVTSYADAMNLLVPPFRHHPLVTNTSSSDIYLQEHVTFDHNLQKPMTMEADTPVMDGDHHEDARPQHEEDGSSCAKKQDHNAKERLRRLKLHASYLSLGTLLPDSHASKKKWSAPVIMDRVLTYIPKLQTEVEQLTLRKQQIMKAIIETKKPWERGKPSSSRGSPDPIAAVSVRDLGRDGEAIVQICVRNEREDGFSDLMRALESQGMSILSASTALVCSDQRILIYHLHVKMHEDLCGANDISVMKEKIISSLM